jgi:hypothetical protein
VHTYIHWLDENVDFGATLLHKVHAPLIIFSPFFQRFKERSREKKTIFLYQKAGTVLAL